MSDAQRAPAPKIRAAVLSSGNPRDVRLWSGIPFHMLKALESQFDLVAVVEQPWPWWFHRLGKAMKGLTARRYEYHFSPGYTALAARDTIAALEAARPDVVLAISVSTMAHLMVDRFRIVNIADATVRAMMGYYDSFTRHMGGNGKSADAIEAKTIGGAFLSIYPSTWAHDSAINDYGADPARTQVVEWGSNITATEAHPRTLDGGEVRLLFVGIEFDRKGGPLAIAIVRELAARGIKCRLDIVGVGADAVVGPVPDTVTFHGFVSKANPEGRALIDRLFAEASFFLLPTTAECFGIVFAEAASRGLPSISFATGGVPSAVLSGTTGLLLPLGSDATTFADAIGDIVASPDRYAAMSAAALNDAHTRLDWDVWARRVAENVRRQIEIEGVARP